MENEHEKLKHEYERVSQLRGAYNSDKKVLVDRIQELENEIKTIQDEKTQLEHRLQLIETSS